jgi:hypothetical protein
MSVATAALTPTVTRVGAGHTCKTGQYWYFQFFYREKGGGRGRVGTGTSVTVHFSVDFYPFQIPDPGPGSNRHQIQDGRYHSCSEFDKLV